MKRFNLCWLDGACETVEAMDLDEALTKAASKNGLPRQKSELESHECLSISEEHSISDEMI